MGGTSHAACGSKDMPARNQELELKFALTDEALERLLATEFAEVEAEEIVSIYYDTPDRALRDANMSLRLRRQGGRWVQTVKDAGEGGLARYESERAVNGDRLDRKHLRTTPVRRCLDDAIDELAPVFETRVSRAVLRKADEGGEVEV